MGCTVPRHGACLQWGVRGGGNIILNTYLRTSKSVILSGETGKRGNSPLGVEGVGEVVQVDDKNLRIYQTP